MPNIINCPLCAGKRYAVLRLFSMKDLADIWQKKVGFNPFHGLTSWDELQKLLCMDCGLVHYTPSIIGDHAFYAKLSVFDWYYPKNKWEFDFAIDLVKQYQPQRILEVGCGAGEFLHRLTHCAKRVVGIDINQQAIATATKRGLSVSNQSAKALNEHFDLIFMFQVLEHLASPKQFVGELVETLEPGGHLVLAVPNPDGYMQQIEKVFLDMPPHHATCWSHAALKHLASMHGLEQVCYATEPINMDYLRAQLFAQIDQSSHWRIIKLAQKVLVLALLPLLYMMRNLSTDLGQTHVIVLRKKHHD